MDQRIARLTHELQTHDRKLFAKRVSNGMIQIHRYGERLSDCDFDPEFGPSGPASHFICALTENWTLQGKPVDWGIDPVMARIRDMDLWGSATSLDQIRAQRERNKESKAQTKRNELRAIAADMRKDFARATNDINTASL